MKRLLLMVMCLCLLFTACGRKADCPEGAREAIDAYVAERKNIEGMRTCRLYSIEQENDLLYKFQYKEYLDYEPGSLYAQKYGYFHGLLCTAYASNVNGIWQIHKEYSLIPVNIRLGVQCPKEVLDTFLRWTDNTSVDGEGSWDTHVELCYWGEEAAPAYPGVSVNTALTWDINSIIRVNDGLYEMISTVTDKHIDEPITYQHFVGLVDGEWKIMLYDAVPEALRDGLEAFDEYRFTEDGIEIIPAK